MINKKKVPMKNSIKHRFSFPIIAVVALIAAASPLRADENVVTIIPPDATYHGKTYPEWTAAFWQFALALPIEDHPFLTEEIDFSAGQKGSVWFWGAPDGPFTRHISMPPGKALFLTVRDVEVSTLEAPPFFGATEEEQRTQANWFADRIIDLFDQELLFNLLGERRMILRQEAALAGNGFDDALAFQFRVSLGNGIPIHAQFLRQRTNGGQWLSRA